MDLILHFHVFVFLCKILEGQTIAWDENSLSRPVITRNHRRLKGFNFNTFHSASLVSCGLQCQRNPRCVSANFRKVSSLDKTKSKTKGICELNERGVPFPMEEKELERDKESVYTQFYDTKQHDCQLTSCLNAGSCTFIEESKVFNCKCQAGWCGKYCGVRPAPVGMESGAILDSQISASTEYNSNLAARRARLHLKAGEGNGAGSWTAGQKNENQWLQVDLNQITRVMGIATQGRNKYPQWVKKYKLKYGDDGHAFTFYRRIGDQSNTNFQANSDSNTVVYHDLNPIIEARYIRVRPTQWRQHISMRMELYSC